MSIFPHLHNSHPPISVQCPLWKDESLFPLLTYSGLEFCCKGTKNPRSNRKYRRYEEFGPMWSVFGSCDKVIGKINVWIGAENRSKDAHPFGLSNHNVQLFCSGCFLQKSGEICVPLITFIAFWCVTEVEVKYLNYRNAVRVVLWKKYVKK